MKDDRDAHDLAFLLAVLLITLIVMGLVGCTVTFNQPDLWCDQDFTITSEPEHRIHQECPGAPPDS
jgi:hypothetical protein